MTGKGGRSAVHGLYTETGFFHRFLSTTPHHIILTHTLKPKHPTSRPLSCLPALVECASIIVHLPTADTMLRLLTSLVLLATCSGAAVKV